MKHKPCKMKRKKYKPCKMKRKKTPVQKGKLNVGFYIHEKKKRKG